MNKKFLLSILLILFTISIVSSSDWCEWREIDVHSTNTSKGEWIDYNNSEFINGLGKWKGTGSISTDYCEGLDENSCGNVAYGTYLNYTLPWTYCPNMTLSWIDSTYYPSGVLNVSVCGNTYEYISAGYVYRKYITNINPYCPNYDIHFQAGGSTQVSTIDNVIITCNFANASGIGVPSNIDKEFYAYPEQYLEVGTLPNETYPNVTYKLNLTMSNYTPSCSDSSLLDKYGWFISTVSLLPKEISWYEQHYSCIQTLNETQVAEQTHYPFTNPLKAGCKALVNFRNATLTCNFIKYNTTIGSDVPTMTIISPPNSTYPILINPITFSVNMSNNKCIDVWVQSHNQDTGYNDFTVLSSVDGYYFEGIDNLTNGTHTSYFICEDGCGHYVNNSIIFKVYSEGGEPPTTTTIPTTTTTYPEGYVCTARDVCVDDEISAFQSSSCVLSDYLNCNSTGDGYCYGGRCYEIPSPAFNSSSSVLDILEGATSGIKGLLGWISLPLFKILLAIGIVLLILGIFGLVVSVAEKSTKWSRR